MEGLYDVVFTLCDKIVFKTDGLSSFEDAISTLETIHLGYEVGIIYGYDQNGLRYIVHKRELHLSSGIQRVA